MATPALNRVERALLAILDGSPDEEVSGRALRSLLRGHGFRRTAPAFTFTMMSLEDKGLVACREVARVVEGVEVKDRYYRKLWWPPET
jgi:hypothetical protein